MKRFRVRLFGLGDGFYLPTYILNLLRVASILYSRGINQSTILLVICNIQRQRCLELFYLRIILCQQACDSYVQQIASEYLNHD